MPQNIFEFRNSVYKIENGTAMGNSLSPLIAEFFMSKFEEELTQMEALPKVWIRYVDDIFSFVKKDQLQNTLNVLNSQYESIKFTVEVENENSLPFLDLRLTRINNKIDISVYHKPTSTKRYITSDSYCPIQHKLAVFNSMVFRLCKLPLSVMNYMAEYNYILNVAEINGYGASIVDKLIKKHALRVKKSEWSTLFAQNKRLQRKEEKSSTALLRYNKPITNMVSTELKKLGWKVAYYNSGSLKNTLGNPKDKTPVELKSGIYEITCNSNGCGAKYYGQTKRNIKTRCKEYLDNIKKNQHTRSAVALHAQKNLHLNLTSYDIKLVKEVNKEQRLDAYESYFIQKCNNAMNTDDGNIKSNLFSLL